MWGRRARALPGTATRSGWRCSGDGELRVSSGALILCEKSEEKKSGRCARRRGRGLEDEGGAWLTVDDEFVQRCLQTCGPPTRKLGDFVASRADKRKGEGRGGLGLL
jgi:hypothetical protein